MNDMFVILQLASSRFRLRFYILYSYDQKWEKWNRKAIVSSLPQVMVSDLVSVREIPINHSIIKEQIGEVILIFF